MGRKEIKEALQARDLSGLSAAMLVTPNGDDIARKIIENELPAQDKVWWMHDNCDEAHDPISIAQEIGKVIRMAGALRDHQEPK